jgi:hypothetical protein
MNGTVPFKEVSWSIGVGQLRNVLEVEKIREIWERNMRKEKDSFQTSKELFLEFSIRFPILMRHTQKYFADGEIVLHFWRCRNAKLFQKCLIICKNK